MATISSLKIEKGPSRWQRAIRITLWLGLALMLLLIVTYLVVTSPGFIKRFILPRVGTALQAEVTVTDVSVHPFSKIVLRGLKVQAKGQEPFLIAPEIRASYSLWSILRGNLRVSELTLVSPTIVVVENPDGTRNLAALGQEEEKSAPQKTPAPKSSRPLRLDVRKITVSDATFRKIRKYAGNRRDFLEVANLSVTLANLKNGQAGTLQLGALIQMEANPPGGRSGHLQGTLNGDFSFTLSADLKPAPFTGQARLDISRADGAFGDFDRFSAVLDCNISPTEIKPTMLRFQKAGAPLGQLAVSGPLDMEKMQGRLKVELRGIDRRLLNLLSAGAGMDFNGTTLNSSNDIELTKAGSVISASGRFDATNLQLTRAGQTTPAFNLSVGYALTLDTVAGTLLLRGLNLTGTQNDNPLLTAHLAQPMNIAWGESAGGAGDATLDLAVTGLNLDDWRPFLGDKAAAGNVGLTLKVTSSRAGRQLGFDLDSRVQSFSYRFGDRLLAPVTVSFHARGQAADFKQFSLSECRLQIVRDNQSLAIASGSGTYDTADQGLDLQVALQASLAVLGQALPAAGLNFASGTLELKSHVTQKKDVQNLTGQLELANLTGQSGKSQFRSFGATVNLDIAKTPEQIQINKFNGNLTANGNAGGMFEVSGKCNPQRNTARLTAKLSGLNQNGLRPFLEPLLAGKQLVSIAITGDASVDYDPDSSSTVKASIQVGKLVVYDSPGQVPSTPLEAGLQVDAGVKKQSVDVRRFQITLSPTARGKNQVQLQGQVDYAQSDAVHGNLKLDADSLDLTSYYDLFAGSAKGGVKPAPASAPGESASTNQEPPAKKLPFKNFTLAVNIGKLSLHEVEISDWQTTATLEGSLVTLKPFKLLLNGAPVNGSVNLNLGVPGYRYDVAVAADRVPVAPLVNTFMPERQGQMNGTCTANLQFKGAGVTGTGLQRNLAGQFSLGITNLNLAIENVHSPVLRGVINVVAALPELLVNPASALTTIVGQLTGQGGGLMDALRQSPIEIINAQGRAGSGQIELQRAMVQSRIFEADARGTIALAQVLTNSTINIPVTVSVSQPVAKQLNLNSSKLPANAAYVPLPQFLTMTGTLGAPKTDINKLALGGLTVKSIGTSLLNTTTNAASNVGHLLNNLINTIKPK